MQYAKRMVGPTEYGGTSTYIPLKVNQAGVIPVIFASSLLYIPQLIGQLDSSNERRRSPGRVDQQLPGQRADHSVYMAAYFVLIIFFTYFYVGDHVQPRRGRRQHEEVRRLHPGHPAGPPDGGVPAASCCRHHLPGLAVPGHHRGPADRLHRPARPRTPELPVRRHQRADHGRRRPRHREADREPADAAQLRRLPRDSAPRSSSGRPERARGPRPSSSPRTCRSRRSRPATSSGPT